MKSASFCTHLAVSCVLALTVALTPALRADTYVTVNPDGSVTRTEITAPNGISSAPLASLGMLQTPKQPNTNTTVVINRAPASGANCVAGYPSYPGYYPPAPGYYGSYVAPAPAYSMPIGRPTGAVSQPWITSIGGATTYGYYAPPACVPSYPANGYPTGGYPCVPAPTYGYNGYPAAAYPYTSSPYSTSPYSSYPYTSSPYSAYPAYPGNYGAARTSNFGSFSAQSGGLSVTFGGGRTTTNTYTNSYPNGYSRRHR